MAAAQRSKLRRADARLGVGTFQRYLVRKRLARLSRDLACAVSVRGALRAFPAILPEVLDRQAITRTLSSFRGLISAGCASFKPNPEMLAAAGAAAVGKRVVFESQDGLDRMSVPDIVGLGAVAAAGFAARGGLDMAFAAVRSAFAVARDFETTSAAVAALDSDLDIAEYLSLSPLPDAHLQLLETPAWSKGASPWFSDKWRDCKARLFALDAEWSVLTDWYDARVAGWSEREAYEESWASLSDDEWSQESAPLFRQLRRIQIHGGHKTSMRSARAIFLGAGDAGKTSLIRRLKGERVTENDAQTEGQELSILELDPVDSSEVLTPIESRAALDLVLDKSRTKIAVYVSDFAGQTLAHGIHQFFLRDKCLYVVVLNGRSRDDCAQDADYWLSFLSVLEGKSPPAIIVGNKAEKSAVAIDMRGLAEKHPNISPVFHALSCVSTASPWRERLNAFNEEFRQTIIGLAADGLTLSQGEPDALVELRETLMAENRISLNRAMRILESHGIQDANAARDLLRRADTVGLIFWLGELPVASRELKAQVFSPNWLTEGVYSVLFAPSAREAGGVLSKDEFFDALVRDGSHYSDEDARLLLDAMTAFGAAFQQDGKIIIPALLPVGRPSAIPFDTSRSVALRLRFESFLPPQLLPMIMARRIHELQSNGYWRGGALFKGSHYNAEALVLAAPEENNLRIYARGPQRTAYLAALVESAKLALARTPSAAFAEEVRVRQEVHQVGDAASLEAVPESQLWVDFRTVLTAEAHHHKTFPHLTKVLNTSAILSDAPADRRMLSGDVFISWAHVDEDMCRYLREMLGSRAVDYWWDDKIPGRAGWLEVINERIARAKALLVIWTNASASSDMVQYEVAKAGDKALGLAVDGLDFRRLPQSVSKKQLIPFGDADRLREELRALGVQML